MAEAKVQDIDGNARSGTGRGYLSVLLKRWYVVVLAVLIGGGVGAAVSYTATPFYDSTASVYFAVQTGGTASDLSQSGNFAQSQMPTFASFATLPVVMDPVIKKLGLQQTAAGLASAVTVTTSSTTVIIDITARDASATQAASIANTVADQLATVVTSLSVRNTSGNPSVVARKVATALPAVNPSSPRTGLNIGAGVLAGLLLGYLLAYLWQRLDKRVRTVDDATTTAHAPLLGQIWSDRALGKGHQVMIDGTRGPLAEAIRSIRTNLQFLRINGESLVAIVTSSMSGEGKTMTSINLAIALAETEARVLLIDADLRRPSVATKLNLEGAVGLTTVLIGQAELSGAIQPWGDTGLDVLTSGQIPPNPSELLGSAAMLELLDDMAAHYDYVLLDSAPLLPVTDTAVLAMSGFGAVLVTAVGEITRPQVREAVAALEHVGGRTLGIVVNKLPPRSVKRATYTYGAPDDAPIADTPVRPVPGLRRSRDTDGIEAVRIPDPPSSTGDRSDRGRNGAVGAEASRLVRAARHQQAKTTQE